MSLVLQAKYADTEQERTFALVLAERMLSKCREENRLATTEQCYLYMSVLDMRNRPDVALEFLQHARGGERMKMVPSEKLKMKLKLLHKLSTGTGAGTSGKWVDVCKLARAILSAGQGKEDDWECWTAWLDALDHLGAFESSTASSGPNGDATPLLTEFREFVRPWVTPSEPKDTHTKRGPYLAQLELEDRLARPLGSSRRKVIELLAEYFQVFGDKLCFYGDVRPYLDALTQVEDKIGLVDALRKDLPVKVEWDGTNESSVLEAKKRCLRDIALYKVQARLGLLCDKECVQATVQVLIERYQEAFMLGEGLEETERQYGDDYLLLACQLLLWSTIKHHTPTSTNWSSKTEGLIQIAVLLEQGIKKSKFNYAFKLLLMRIYLLLGAFERVVAIYTSLDIKHMQHDSMGHYVIPFARCTGYLDCVKSLLSAGYSISLSNVRETPEMICQAYKYSTFSKIDDFIQFGRRIENSIHQTLIRTEKARLNLITSQSHHDLACLPPLESQFYAKLMDNRDLKVLECWLPEREIEIELETRPHAPFEKGEVELQALVLHMVRMLVKGVDNVEIESVLVRMDVLIREWKSAVPVDRVKIAFLSELARCLINKKSVAEYPSTGEFQDLVPGLSDNIEYSTLYCVSELVEVVCILVALKDRYKLDSLIKSMSQLAKEALKNQRDALKQLSGLQVSTADLAPKSLLSDDDVQVVFDKNVLQSLSTGIGQLDNALTDILK